MLRIVQPTNVYFGGKKRQSLQRDCTDSVAFVELSQLLVAEFQRHSRYPLSNGLKLYIYLVRLCNCWSPDSNTVGVC